MDRRDSLAAAPEAKANPEAGLLHVTQSAYAEIRVLEKILRGAGQFAPVLTDDLNPVDIWSDRINLSSRKQLHGYFGDEDLNW